MYVIWFHCEPLQKYVSKIIDPAIFWVKLIKIGLIDTPDTGITGFSLLVAALSDLSNAGHGFGRQMGYKQVVFSQGPLLLTQTSGTTVDIRAWKSE